MGWRDFKELGSLRHHDYSLDTRKELLGEKEGVVDYGFDPGEFFASSAAKGRWPRAKIPHQASSSVSVPSFKLWPGQEGIQPIKRFAGKRFASGRFIIREETGSSPVDTRPQKKEDIVHAQGAGALHQMLKKIH